MRFKGEDNLAGGSAKTPLGIRSLKDYPLQNSDSNYYVMSNLDFVTLFLTKVFHLFGSPIIHDSAAVESVQQKNKHMKVRGRLEKDYQSCTQYSNNQF